MNKSLFFTISLLFFTTIVRAQYNQYLTQTDVADFRIYTYAVSDPILMTACATAHSNKIVAEGDIPVRISDSYSFTEGPAVDAKANRILKYDIQKDGSISNRQVFANMGSDGMTIDDRGNIYLTGDGVTVFDKNGQQIAHFPIPEDWTANVCFGGKERDVLFITASKSVYTLKMLVHGVK